MSQRSCTCFVKNRFTTRRYSVLISILFLSIKRPPERYCRFPGGFAACASRIANQMAFVKLNTNQEISRSHYGEIAISGPHVRALALLKIEGKGPSKM